MHLKRTQITKSIPIPRKGTKYVARAADHYKNGVPVVIAIRDMLKLAKTSNEVKHMIKDKLIKINGKKVKDAKESVKLFNILEADQNYKLIILPTRKFAFEKTRESHRLCKIVNKKSLKNNNIQLNLHDGTNIIIKNKEKIKTGCSVELDLSNKIKKNIPLEEGKEIFVISGKSSGLEGKIREIKGNNVKIKLKGVEKEVELGKKHIIVK